MKARPSLVLPPSRPGKVLTAAALFFLLQTAPVFPATWYVAPGGADSNSGASGSPFATIMYAQSKASSGDMVYLRGGTYYLNNSNLTWTNSAWAIVNNITNNGISYLAWFPAVFGGIEDEVG